MFVSVHICAGPPTLRTYEEHDPALENLLAQIIKERVPKLFMCCLHLLCAKEDTTCAWSHVHFDDLFVDTIGRHRPLLNAALSTVRHAGMRTPFRASVDSCASC